MIKDYKTIKSYITAQPKELKPVLNEMYEIVRSSAPLAKETIKYGIPTFVGKKNIGHFAAMKKHLGFYPTPTAITNFEKELVLYSTSKGCVRFDYKKQLPKSLIAKMVRFRVKEDLKIS
jgi:uncharacterized protein YdhG (YjbR/CyaY superfamily)